MFDTPDASAPARALRPRPAATLIIVDRDGPQPRVLMGARHDALAFMPNKVVFPGGRVDPGDHKITPAKPLQADVAAALAKESTMAPQALALAAVRETVEETGVILGVAHETAARTRSTGWRNVLRHGFSPRLDVLTFIARAITPPYRPRRFDARFFMADARHIAGRIPAEPGGELRDVAWLTLAEARARDLPAITLRVLAEVEARLAAPERPRPIPFFRFRHGRPVVSEL